MRTYLATRLDPNERINKSVSSIGGWARTKACTLNIAPIAPRLLSSRLLSRTSDVNDEVCREALGAQQRCERVDEALFIAVLVALSKAVACGNAEGVVVGHVGNDTTDSTGRSSSFVHLCVELGRWANVSVPAEPAGVSTIKVHIDIGEVESLERVDGQFLVVRGGAGAFCYVHVCDHVCKSYISQS